jgi:hypothetical protein
VGDRIHCERGIGDDPLAIALRNRAVFLEPFRF